ncbi:MAG TPA: energy-coupling factor transporter ATPase [Candidatus Limnocylindrales bacterium]|nr:energy-coupling factor transporter ATPase [Candidatus Limnocylindrales bacterium]
MSVLEVNDFWWKYRSYIGAENPFTLKGLSFTVNKGEFFGIIGPSGAGKTTLCYALTGIIPHVFTVPRGKEQEHIKGEIKLFGQTLTKVEAVTDETTGRMSTMIVGKKQTAQRVGLLLQDPENQFLRMDLLHEISFGMELLGLPESEIEKRGKEALEIVGLGNLWPIADLVHPSELSGGQKQRAAIASFIALRPELLVLDEPMSDLDPEGKLSIIQAIDSIRNEYDVTTIVVEHNPEIIQKYADRVLAINNGQMIAYGTTEEVYCQSKLFDENGLYASDIARIGWKSSLNYKGRIPFTVEEIMQVFEDKKQEPKANVEDDPPDEKAEEIISVKDLDFSYEDGTQALKGVTFSIRKGEIVGLIGQNGAGKSTVSKIISGLYKKFRGEVKIMGLSLRDKKMVQRIPCYVGYVFQNPDNQIFMRKVYDEVAYGLKNLKIPQQEVDLRVKEALKSVGLLSKIDEDPMFLGKGEKRRLTVASILAMNPKIMIVDEPTTGQDFRMSEDIMNLLEELNKAGTTILAITHDMTLVSEHTKRVIVMHNGSVLYDGSTRGFFANEELLEKAGIIAPLAVRLSHAYRKNHPSSLCLMNAKEWVTALNHNGKETG